jgi:hypothetical protein
MTQAEALRIIIEQADHTAAEVAEARAALLHRPEGYRRVVGEDEWADYDAQDWRAIEREEHAS